MKRIGLVVAAVTLAVVATGCFFNVTSYRDEDGSLVYVGGVMNEGGPLDDPVVEGTFYDANGNVIATQSGPACRVMPNKGLAAFKVVLPPGTPDPARVEWKLTGRSVENEGLAVGLSGQLFGTGPAFPGANKASVFGEMRNDSSNVYTRGYACVAWVNATGEIVRVATGTAAGLRFAPGSTLPFMVSEDVPPEAVAALFFLDAGVTLPGTPAPSYVDIPLSAFQHSTQRSGPGFDGGTLFFGIGEVQNDGSTSIVTNVSAVTRDGTGHPNGVSQDTGFCNVPAEPGGFTYGSYILVSAAPPTPALDIKIEGIQVPATATVQRLGVSGVGLAAAESGQQRVTATVRNTTSSILNRVSVCAGVYDASGTVIGAFPGTASLPSGGLPPNDSVNVSVDVPTFGSPSTAKLIAAGAP